ncbi:MAG: hypothetical protein CL840_06840 [Crocinitomicaceae bacterium]|nr:hypothetical protein [Crocinitomicaceae bacterium]|tara:strand:- start:18835 stop:19221 length:387 start_codon:yes stop_codon:yes gene_type:complete
MKSKKIEGWGLVLLLISFGWQMLDTELANSTRSAENYQFYKKFDAIYMLLSDMYSNSDYNDTPIRSSANFKHINGSWKIWSQMEAEKSNLKWQSEIVSVIRAVIFITGSILIIATKFYDFDNKKHEVT